MNIDLLRPRQGRPTVLIVDDTPSNIDILALGLRKFYEVKVATSGRAALQMLKTEKADLILLDVMMPELDGYAVCQQLKRDINTRDIPIIFVTAKDATEDQNLGFNLGAVDYIVKPFDMQLVRARVAVHVRMKLKSERLERLAMVDGLTDIANRRALDEMLLRENGRASRSAVPLALLMIDIDHFKEFNDNYGHGAGDECLRHVAQTLEHALRRPTDFIGRYGGEEFCVILPASDLHGATRVGEALRMAVQKQAIPHAHSSAGPVVTISVGAAARLIGQDEVDQPRLCKEADAALYLAKTEGRNRVVGAVAPVEIVRAMQLEKSRC